MDDIWVGMVRNDQNQIVSIWGYESLDDALRETDRRLASYQKRHGGGNRILMEIRVFTADYFESLKREKTDMATEG